MGVKIMGNNLNIDIEGKFVIASGEAYYGNDVERVFFATGGFGCAPYTYGSCVGGYFVVEGEKARCRIEGYEVTRLATEGEIKQAQELARKNKVA